MKDWNTPNHHIADTDHGALHFAGGVTLVIADWEVIEQAPDSDGRIYASVCGWLANSGGAGRSDSPFTEPIDAGRAHLTGVELRGQRPITDRAVHIDYYNPGQPCPNTWDHRGCQVTVSWMDRRIDQDGQLIPEDEIGRTEWTHPETGKDFDLTIAYLPKGDYYSSRGCKWRHYDGWRDGVPVLHPFYPRAKTPVSSGRLLTDGEWVPASEAPTIEEVAAAAQA